MIKWLMARLQALNPAQQAIQLAAINQILKGLGAVVDIQMPTEAQKTQGRPKGAPNKPKTTKRDPSAFKNVEKKRKLEEKQSNQSKKQKLNKAKAEMKAFQKADQKRKIRHWKKKKRWRKMRCGITAHHLKRGSSLLGTLVVKLPRLNPQFQRRRSNQSKLLTSLLKSFTQTSHMRTPAISPPSPRLFRTPSKESSTLILMVTVASVPLLGVWDKARMIT
jgi:hypothetical protein